MTLDALGDVGVVCTDRELSVIRVMGSAIGDLGWRSDQMLGQPIGVAVPAEHHQRLAGALSAALAGEQQALSLAGPDRRTMFDFRIGPTRGEDDHTVVGVTVIIRQAADSDSVGHRDERLGLLMDAASDYAIFMLDPDGRVATWDPGADQFMGYSAKEIIGGSFSRFYPPEDIALGKPAWELKKAAREGRIETEGWRVRKDGTRFWADVVITAVHDAEGQLLGFGKVTRELTERHQAEQALRESETRFWALLEAALDPIVIVDESGVIMMANAQAENLLRYQREELLGSPVGMLLPELLADEHGRLRAELFTAPDGIVMGPKRDLFALRRDGHHLPVEVRLTPLPGEGQLVSVSIRDVSARKAAEDRLRMAEDGFRNAFMNAPLGVALISAKPATLGRYLQVNRAMCKLAGLTEEAVLALDVQSLTLADDLGATLEAFSDLLGGRVEHHQAEMRYRHAMGHPIDVSVSLSLARRADGSPTYFIAQVEDVGQRKRYERELAYMAGGHDPLSGLLNREHFLELLERHLLGTRRYGATGALLTVDLDHFDQVNDRAGRATGDQIIATVARLIGARVRESDVIARLDGDEFVVLMHDGGEPEAETLASELSYRIRRGVRLDTAAGPLTVTASIGVRVVDSPDLTSQELMTEAKEAMSAAKRAGRNRIALHLKQPASDQRRPARMTLHNHIERALELGGFELYAQPVMRLSDETVVKYELLLRMRTDDGRLLAPSTFLYVAERFDQIGRIDRWVVDQAVRLAVDPRVDPSMELEINLSARSIGDRDLLEFIRKRIKDLGADPRRLVFEITETAAVENIQSARDFATELTLLGCKFALDDFGVGFGSFYYLKYIPFDFLKIDGEFIKTATKGRTDQLIVQACVQLAKGLGKSTIAEFVETAETLRMLRELGVDYAQGFHVARPLPVGEALGLQRPGIGRPPSSRDEHS
jgi:diguanylate cyclase (GGDEF)-like protein/PAS domain S-box-containing protein